MFFIKVHNRNLFLHRDTEHPNIQPGFYGSHAPAKLIDGKWGMEPVSPNFFLWLTQSALHERPVKERTSQKRTPKLNWIHEFRERENAFCKLREIHVSIYLYLSGASYINI